MKKVISSALLIVLTGCISPGRVRQPVYHPVYQQPFPHQGGPQGSGGNNQRGPIDPRRVFNLTRSGQGTGQGAGKIAGLQSGVSAADRALINAVRSAGGASAYGQPDPAICSMAQDHARSMANRNSMDHAGFEKERYPHLASGGSEIVAMNSGGGTSLDEHAATCVRSWQDSPRHSPDLQNPHGAYCYSMVQSQDNKFYCVGLFANGGTTEAAQTGLLVQHSAQRASHNFTRRSHN